MARYFWRKGDFVDRDGKAMDLPYRGQVCRPYVQSDIQEYASPIDGKPVTSRSHRREEMKRNGCVDYEPTYSPSKHGFKNKRFAEKRSLQLSEEFR